MASERSYLIKTRPIPVPANWENLKWHRLACPDEFGLAIDLDALVASMQARGYDEQEPIILYEGLILDGRHRQKAAIHAEVTPTFREFYGGDPTAYLEKEIGRRHRNKSQIAFLVATIVLERQKKGLGPGPNLLETQSEIANKNGVDRRTLREATRIVEQGTPELKKAVASGTVSTRDASQILNQPAKVQREAVRAVEQGTAPTATAAVRSDEPEPFNLTEIRDLGEKIRELIHRMYLMNETSADDESAELLHQSRDLEERIRTRALQLACRPTPEPPPKQGRRKSRFVFGGQLFEKFWKAYPRHQAKRQATKAWNALKPTPELVDRMLAAIETQKTWRSWQEGFIPHAATWINGGRWEDEEPPATPKPPPPKETREERIDRQLRELSDGER